MTASVFGHYRSYLEGVTQTQVVVSRVYFMSTNNLLQGLVSQRVKRRSLLAACDCLARRMCRVCHVSALEVWCCSFLYEHLYFVMVLISKKRRLCITVRAESRTFELRTVCSSWEEKWKLVVISCLRLKGAGTRGARAQSRYE